MSENKNINLNKEMLSLEYHGKPVQAGCLDSYVVAKNIKTFSDVLISISRNAYLDTQIKTEVIGFRGNSFDIDFCVKVISPSLSLLATMPGAPKEIIEWIKQTIALFRHLNGKPPKSIEGIKDNNILRNVTNSEGVINQFHNSTINIIGDEGVRAFFRSTFEEQGFDSMDITAGKSKKKEITIKKEDAKIFSAIEANQENDTELINEAKVWLTIEGLHFKEGHKWQVNDGNSSFFVKIEDKKFLSAVDARKEKFGKGDMLLAKLRIIQKKDNGKDGKNIKAEKIIVEIIKHTAKDITEQTDFFDR